MRDLVDELLQAKVKTKLFGGEHAPRLGRLVILDRIGSGAMGTVFAAYDPKLERKVAIKVVAASARVDTLLAEARSLARLAHPNVVAVHDVGEEAGLVYIVMELVPGVPLRAWTSDRGRPWRDVMRVLRDAAKGIAAAHGAGLVHRDIKPDNILVDAASGTHRARVVDFGLANAGGDHKSAGTPSYMAPEALADGEVTAASDQFSFGVTMFEALYGVRPHAAIEASITTAPADTPPPGARAGLAAAAELAANAHPPGGSSVPAWVHAVIVRTLAADPAQRFPAMSDVVVALSRDRRRARFAAIVAATAVIGAGLGAVTMRGSGSTCDDGASHLASVWDESRRAGVRSALAGAPWTARTVAALDDASASWEVSYRRVCEATRLHGGQSDALLELRMRCLDRALDRFSALVSALAGPSEQRAGRDGPTAPAPNALDATARVAAPAAVAELPRADSCETLADAAELALPTDPARRARAIEAERELDRGWAAFGLGRYRDARAIAASTGEVLATIDAPALHATALVLSAAVEARIGAPADAKAKLAAALDAAAASRAGTLELDVWARLLRSELFSGTPAHVIEWAPFARAAAARAGRKGAEIDGIVAEALRDSGRLRDAKQLLDHALVTTDPLRADQRAVLELNLGSIQLATGDSVAATKTFQTARDRVIDAYGDRHPDLALYYDKLAAAATARGKIRDALALHTKSAELRTAAFGVDDRAVATSLFHRAQTELEAGELAVAGELLAQARAIRAHVFGDASPRLGELDAALGDVAVARGELDAARQHYASAKQLDVRLDLTARSWFAKADIAADAIPAPDPDEAFTTERVTALWVRAQVLRATPRVVHDFRADAELIFEHIPKQADPALLVALGRIEDMGGYPERAAEHFAAALAQSGNEPTRTALDAAIGLAWVKGEDSAQAARTAVALFQALPQLDRKQLVLNGIDQFAQLRAWAGLR